MDRLYNVCMALGLKGYYIAQKSYVREVGTVSWDGSSSHQKHAMPFKFDDLNSVDKKMAKHRKRHVHGLNFDARENENAHDQTCLELYILNLCEEARSGQVNVVTYREGQVEKELLDKLKIPNIDLKELGCPETTPRATGCDFHIDQLCCAKAECDELWRWIEDTILNAKTENGHTELLVECPEFD